MRPQDDATRSVGPNGASRNAPRGLYDPSFEHDACGIALLADLSARRSHGLVDQAITALEHLDHRGAKGADKDTGDGAGILVQIPHEFFAEVVDFELPGPDRYAAGLVFLPQDADDAAKARRRIADLASQEGLDVLGWRDVPIDPTGLGSAAHSAMPAMAHVFVAPQSAGLQSAAAPPTDTALEIDRLAFCLRKRIEHEVPGTYIPSLSARTIVYKGMLTTSQLRTFFPDLSDARFASAIALVHSRFSTNTFPSWPLAHPYRYIAHNGEINTLRGNRNWMRARETLLRSDLIPGDLQRLFPIVDPDASDSATFDEVLELLHLGGRSLPHAVLMMIPEAWENHTEMDPARRAFYQFHAALMEPWDGPAAVVFTDGRLAGAVLDRNGLRPARFWVTDDGLVILSSEVGVLDIDPHKIVRKGRLQPGKMFLVDTTSGRLVEDDEIKAQLAAEHPYGEWLETEQVHLDDLPPRTMLTPQHSSVVRHQRLFGYTTEEVHSIVGPMARSGGEPLGSMGNDAALAVLSDKPRLIYDYFFQLFAQVTNPPLDAIREELVTSAGATIGPEQNLLEPGPRSCRQIALPYPVIDNSDLAKLLYIDDAGGATGFRAFAIDGLFDPQGGGDAMKRAIDQVCRSVSLAIADGANIVVLSDRSSNEVLAPIPSLLLTAAVHHHLVREKTRTKVGLIVESGDAREVHHMALLLGYGAAAINPYLAFETIDDMISVRRLDGVTPRQARRNYIKAACKGVIKIMSKMGISTVASYTGAQVFEAVGLAPDVVDQYFTGTTSRIGGVGLGVLAEEAARRHRDAYLPRPTERAHRELAVGGEYQWRREGEVHLFNPRTVFKLQHATRAKRYDVFKEYTKLVDDQSRKLATLRGLLRFKGDGLEVDGPKVDVPKVDGPKVDGPKVDGQRGSGSPAGRAESAAQAPFPAPVPLDEVEPVSEIVKRFATGAMSYGSISAEAHETLAIAMNRLGGKSNTGEGGEDARRYVREPNGDLRRSAVHQVASGRFGVTSEYLVNADDLQIKIAQGAKPGEGGQLAGKKIFPWIAATRFTTPGVGLISPPPHHDIYSIEDIAQLIHDLKSSNPLARVHVKLVSEVGVGTVAAGVAKAKSDVVLISGHDGGTGAAPLTSIKHAGIPWELGLAETQQTLVRNGLRDRIVVQVDGQLKTGRDVVIAALLGAEEFGFASAPLVVSGCIMMRVCHLDTCPVGIATQTPALRERFSGKPEFVEHFFEFIATEVREILASLGLRSIEDAVGRVDLLDTSDATEHWKAAGLDLSPVLVLAEPENALASGRRCTTTQDHGLERALDHRFLDLCRPAIESGERVEASLRISNVDRTVGTLLGYEITKSHGAAGLADGTISLEFTGSAGQSFGAFVPKGVTMRLVGDANDYLAKGLSGGRVVVLPPEDSPFAAEEQIIAGNVVLYGATSGEVFLRGQVGERFCVRNSGATAVVEGVGDHACEYMTGGVVVVLGPTGRNFAAGMSGGVAFVWDPHGQLASRLNTELVDLEELDAEDGRLVVDLVSRHLELTGSEVARRLVERWSAGVSVSVGVGVGGSNGEPGPGPGAGFVKVMPSDYRRVLDATRRAIEEGTSVDEAVMAASHG